jgi:hypothetical protein
VFVKGEGINFYFLEIIVTELRKKINDLVSDLNRGGSDIFFLIKILRNIS